MPDTLRRTIYNRTSAKALDEKCARAVRVHELARTRTEHEPFVTLGQRHNTTMAGGKSRWANEEGDAEVEAQRKREKEEKKRAKLEKRQRLEEEALRRAESTASKNGTDKSSDRPAKRRRLSAGKDEIAITIQQTALLRFSAREWGPCRFIDNFERLNHIEEGSYGWVSRAREIATGEVVALKKLKMDNLNDGFPVTALREIQTLKESKHRHIVGLREVVVGNALDEYVCPYYGLKTSC